MDLLFLPGLLTLFEHSGTYSSAPFAKRPIGIKLYFICKYIHMYWGPSSFLRNLLFLPVVFYAHYIDTVFLKLCTLGIFKDWKEKIFYIPVTKA